MINTLKSSVSAVVLTLFLASQATAADVYTKGGGLKDDPAVVASPGVVNWSGAYIGGQVGYGNANHDVQVQGFEPASCRGVDEGVGDGDYTDGGSSGTGPTTAATDCETGETFAASGFRNLIGLDGLNSSGFIGGGRVGIDVARGRYLLGVFGEYNWSNMETELTLSDAVVDGGAKFGLEKDNEWSAGVRLGYIVAPRTLAYGLVAYTQTDYSLNGPAGAFDAADGWKSENTFDGVTVGGGVEFAVASNVFLGMEATHTFYGKETWLNECDGACNIGDVKVTDELDETRVMGTLKIKLNNGLIAY